MIVVQVFMINTTIKISHIKLNIKKIKTYIQKVGDPE